MLEIGRDDNGTIRLSGRFDAAQVERATEFFHGVTDSAVIDLTELAYISSAGLGVLLAAQKSIMGSGGGHRLINASPHVFDVFRYSGFDQIFDITPRKS